MQLKRNLSYPFLHIKSVKNVYMFKAEQMKIKPKQIKLLTLVYVMQYKLYVSIVSY